MIPGKVLKVLLLSLLFGVLLKEHSNNTAFHLYVLRSGDRENTTPHLKIPNLKLNLRNQKPVSKSAKTQKVGPFTEFLTYFVEY